MFQSQVLKMIVRFHNVFTGVCHSFCPQGGGYVQWGGYPPPGYLHLVAATTCTVGKRAVYIILEYFLVVFWFKELIFY